MASPVKILADSTCDLSQQLRTEYEIDLARLYITLGDKNLTDGLEVLPDDIYAHYEKTGELPKTAAYSVADYAELFGSWREKGYEVVHISISQNLSSSHQNACLAAQDMDGVYVVDSRNLSTGSGHLAILGSILAKEGKSAKEIYDILVDASHKVDASFVLDTLAFMAKGGRCSNFTALGANLLKIKPCLEVKNGSLGVCKKYRGSLAKCHQQYVADRLSDPDDIDTRLLFITNSGIDESIVELVTNEVKKHVNFERIEYTRAGCTVSSHCGPNTLGILFFHKGLFD